MLMYGKFRALVTQITDVKKMGRIRVKCPKIYGDSESPYCIPCVPYAGEQLGFFTLPPIGSTVWIEFEEGDVEKPIFSGCWWSEENSPIASYDAQASYTKILRTSSGHTITLSDQPGAESITILDANSNKIEMKSTGVIIESSGNIEINNSGSLKSNGTAIALITDIP